MYRSASLSARWSVGEPPISLPEARKATEEGDDPTNVVK
jgi:hypothetical protein